MASRRSRVPRTAAYDGTVLAVAHQRFRWVGGAGLRHFGKADYVLYDLEYLLPANASDLRL